MSKIESDPCGVKVSGLTSCRVYNMPVDRLPPKALYHKLQLLHLQNRKQISAHFLYGGSIVSWKSI